ncbi:Uncharacterized protein Fot_27302 [Forsythia ovata]|uniref:Uncharacterized protein n=1 Tax=Forsythia ovata TaxID=205694 RepID=A0ABD1UEB2_9LAMI
MAMIMMGNKMGCFWNRVLITYTGTELSSREFLPLVHIPQFRTRLVKESLTPSKLSHYQNPRNMESPNSGRARILPFRTQSNSVHQLLAISNSDLTPPLPSSPANCSDKLVRHSTIQCNTSYVLDRSICEAIRPIFPQAVWVPHLNSNVDAIIPQRFNLA